MIIKLTLLQNRDICFANIGYIFINTDKIIYMKIVEHDSSCETATNIFLGEYQAIVKETPEEITKKANILKEKKLYPVLKFEQSDVRGEWNHD